MKIISLEGPDCCGKTTQSKMLVNELKNNRYKVHYEHFPRYDTKIGNLISYYLKNDNDEIDFLALQTLYIADQIDYKRKIYQLEKEKYDYLILDRYDMSCLVYTISYYMSFLPKELLLNKTIYDCIKMIVNSCGKEIYNMQTNIIKPHITILFIDKCKNIINRIQKPDMIEKNKKLIKNICSVYSDIDWFYLKREKRKIIPINVNKDINGINKEINTKLKFFY